MYTDLFQQLGLAKNEARIYETLLVEGVLSVGIIAEKSGVHRRNVYDSLNRLLEKGLIFEILEYKENRYQAVNPEKLMEVLEEKRQALDTVMPKLQDLFVSTPHKEDVFIYKGLEGWKNQLRDILRISEDVHTIGASGAWNAENLGPFMDQFRKEADKKGINFYTLYNHEARHQQGVAELGAIRRFLPKDYSSPGAADIYGDRVAIVTHSEGRADIDTSTITIIVNKAVADSYRRWWQFMWDHCPDPEKKKKLL